MYVHEGIDGNNFKWKIKFELFPKALPEKCLSVEKYNISTSLPHLYENLFDFHRVTKVLINYTLHNSMLSNYRLICYGRVGRTIGYKIDRSEFVKI